MVGILQVTINFVECFLFLFFWLTPWGSMSLQVNNDIHRWAWELQFQNRSLGCLDSRWPWMALWWLPIHSYHSLTKCYQMDLFPSDHSHRHPPWFSLTDPLYFDHFWPNPHYLDLVDLRWSLVLPSWFGEHSFNVIFMVLLPSNHLVLSDLECHEFWSFNFQSRSSKGSNLICYIIKGWH